MLHIEKFPSNSNGTAVSGRGLLRRKLTRSQRVRLAGDVATGHLHFEHSYGQIAALFGVTVAQLRHELQARADVASSTTAVMMLAQAEAEAVDAAASTIVEARVGASPEARQVALRVIGPAKVWDVLASIVA